jgi:hypothetical protein
LVRLNLAYCFPSAKNRPGSPLGIAGVIDDRFEAPLGFEALHERPIIWFSNAHVRCDHQRSRLANQSAKDVLKELGLALGIWADDQNQARTIKATDVRKGEPFKRLEVGKSLHFAPRFQMLWPILLY